MRARRALIATAAMTAALVPDCLNVGHEKTGALLPCMCAAPSHLHARLKPLVCIVAYVIVNGAICRSNILESRLCMAQRFRSAKSSSGLSESAATSAWIRIERTTPEKRTLESAAS